MVDLGLKWFNGNLARYREDQARQAEIEARDRANETRDREIEREQRQTEREQRQDKRDIALLTCLADPTPENQEKLKAICQEIAQGMEN